MRKPKAVYTALVILLLLSVLINTPVSFLATSDKTQTKESAINAGEIETIAGLTPFAGDGDIAANARFFSPTGCAVDSLGNIYLADSLNFRIRKIDINTGIINTVAGNGSPAFSGDGQLAINAGLAPSDIVFDGSDNIIFSDSVNNRVRKIDAKTGIITTIAGGGTIFGDNPRPTETRLFSPSGLAIDLSGNILIADTNNNRVRRIDARTGAISTIAGEGSGFAGDGDLAVDAKLRLPKAIALDKDGNIFIADSLNNRIRRIDSKTSIIQTVAGTGTQQFFDNVEATSAGIRNPSDIIVDDQGNLLIADAGNNRIRKVDANTKMISTFAGGSTMQGDGSIGDGQLATNARLSFPTSIILDKTGNILIADTGNNRIRVIDSSTKTIITISGKDRYGFTGDGDLATKAMLGGPVGVVTSKTGEIVFIDFINQRIRQINKDGIINTIAGNGKAGFSGDSGLATEASINFPLGLAIDNQGNILIADTRNNRVRKIDVATKIITTVAGNGTPNFSGDGGLAINAGVAFPVSVAVDSRNNVIVLTLDGYVRKIDNTGKITKLAGTGRDDFGGDNGMATNATLNFPNAIALDKEDNIFIADTDNHRVRKIDAQTNIITTVAGNGRTFSNGDGKVATDASILSPIAVAIDSKDNLLIGDLGGSSIRKVDSKTQIINTTIGNGFFGFTGDGGKAEKASLTSIDGLAVDSDNNIYLADFITNVIRVVRGKDSSSSEQDFQLSFDSSSLNIARGKSNQINLKIERTGGFAGNVMITAPDTKAIKVKINPPMQSTTSSSITFNVKVKGKASVGSQTLVFTGKDDSGRVRTANLILVVE